MTVAIIAPDSVYLDRRNERLSRESGPFSWPTEERFGWRLCDVGFHGQRRHFRAGLEPRHQIAWFISTVHGCQKSICALNFINVGWSTAVGVSHVVAVGLNAWL